MASSRTMGDNALAMPLNARPPWFRPAHHLLAAACLLLGLAVHAREVRVGVYANEPKIFLGADGHVSGILGELLQEVARREDWTLVPMPCEWQACLSATENGQIDLMPDVAYSEARAKVLDFHKVPALHSWSQVFRREGVNIQSVLDLQGLRIAILQGSVQQDYFAGLLTSFGVKPTWVPVPSLGIGFERVAKGQADAMIANYQFGSFQAARYKLVETPLMFQPVQLFYASAKGRNAELLAALDTHLADWQNRPGSFYFDLLQRWGGARPRTLVPTGAWWGLAALLGLLLLSTAGTAVLRRQVALKTRHLRASEDRLNTILNSVDAYIYIKDPELRYQYANRKVCELFGRPMADVVGRRDDDFFDAATVDNLRRNDLRVLAQGERVAEEETNTSPDGARTQTYLSVKLPLRQPDGGIYALCGISTDISEQKRAREEIRQLAFYDPLTRLPNRRLLLDRLVQTLAASQRDQLNGALFFIDLDNFKTVNDTLGHDKGDQLLRQVAQRLAGCVRNRDDLARLGSDEFVLVLSGLDQAAPEATQQAERLGQQVLQALGEPHVLGEQRHQSSVSIGIALFSDAQNSTPEELLKRADMAMYQAKADGRNALRFFSPDMQARVQSRVAMEVGLREALHGGQFLLYYQPQADHEGRLFGAEALLRWQHPERGLVLPGQFIAIAESSGLILPMGRWILRTACAQLVQWASQPAMAHLSLAVNVSARQFRHPDFVNEVLAVLEETGAPATRLELELTESQLVDDIEGVVAKMRAIKARGVRFSLDDFGTGYSSLSYLKRLPLDKLKVDRSFVQDLLTDPDDAAIVRTIVALGNSLEIDVIAEGVETLDQRDALARLGCRLYQGYLLGRPGPAEALTGWRIPSPGDA